MLFQHELQQLLLIPSNVALPRTELQNNHKDKIYTDDDIVKMKQEISHLQNRIIKVLYIYIFFCLKYWIKIIISAASFSGQIETIKKSHWYPITANI